MILGHYQQKGYGWWVLIVLSLTGTLVACQHSPEPAAQVSGKIACSDSVGLFSPRTLNIFTMDIDGSNKHQVTNGQSNNSYPDWSPDGSSLSFVSDRDGNNEIYVMQSDGSEQIRLTQRPGDDLFPDWSPDGSRIAFSSRGEGNGLYVMDADGSDQTKLVDWGDYPTWSPDGTQIAFLSDIFTTQISVIPTDGSQSEPTMIVDLPSLTYPHSLHWSSDGSHFVFSAQTAEGKAGIYTITTDGADLKSLTNTTDGISNHFPTWSPDGHAIFFVSDDHNRHKSSLSVIDIDTTDQIHQLESGCTQPDWIE